MKRKRLIRTDKLSKYQFVHLCADAHAVLQLKNIHAVSSEVYIIKNKNQRWYPRLATVLLINRPPEETEKQPKEKS